MLNQTTSILLDTPNGYRWKDADDKLRREYMNSKDSMQCSCWRILPHSSISALPDYLWAHRLKHNI